MLSFFLSVKFNDVLLSRLWYFMAPKIQRPFFWYEILASAESVWHLGRGILISMKSNAFSPTFVHFDKEQKKKSFQIYFFFEVSVWRKKKPIIWRLSPEYLTFLPPSLTHNNVRNLKKKCEIARQKKIIWRKVMLPLPQGESFNAFKHNCSSFDDRWVRNFWNERLSQVRGCQVTPLLKRGFQSICHMFRVARRGHFYIRRFQSTWH